MPKQAKPPPPSRPRPSRWLALCASPWLGLAILLWFQVRRLGDYWAVRETTYGDTTSYFVDAANWYRYWRNRPEWSPVYSAYMSAFFNFTEDAHWIVLAHRYVLILAMAALVYAVLRVLPPALAWLGAAWWCLLAINFDTMYEVHLFSALLPLMALGAALHVPGRRGRAAALFLLLACTLLQRNECIIATAVVAAWIGWTERRETASGRLRAYAPAVLIPLLLTAFFYSRSIGSWAEVKLSAADKHLVNVCQIYAFGYGQRHPEYTASPWLQCQDLMLRDFGSREPAFFGALRANPRAMAEHLWWNLRLVPGGLEVLLLDASGGFLSPASPDYKDFEKRSTGPYLLALALLLAWGGRRLAADWRSYWRERFAGHGLALAVAAGLLTTGAVVALMQRPRPSYLLAVEVVLILGFGIAAAAVLRTWQRAARLAGAAPLLWAVALILVPPYFTARPLGTPVRDLYYRLLPHREAVRMPNVAFMSPHATAEICAYLFWGDCVQIDSSNGIAKRARNEDYASVVAKARPNVAYLNAAELGSPLTAPWLAIAKEQGWEIVAGEMTGPDRWLLMRNRWQPGTVQVILD